MPLSEVLFLLLFLATVVLVIVIIFYQKIKQEGENMKIQLGAEYKDKITGFKGVATGFCEYITGCSQVLLVPKYKNGDKDTSRWYDEQRLDQVGRKVVKLDNGMTPGCDMEPPKDQDGDGATEERN